MHNENTGKPNNNEMDALEAEVREAVANGSHIQDTVHRLTLKAMNAQRIDLDSLQRIITAVMQGAHDGASQQLLQATNQAHAAKSQITEAIAGLDSALARFVEASKLAIEEAAGQAKKFSDTELDTLHHTATAAQGLIADVLLDLSHHAQNTGTNVGSQLKETLATLAQQIASVGHSQVEAGTSLAQKTADFVSKSANGVLSGIKDQSKTGKH